MSEQNEFAKIIAKAWSDEAFRSQLIADPASAFAAEGVAVPEGKQLVVVEDSADTVHFVLPTSPSELSDEALDSVAGGIYIPWCGERDKTYSR